MKEILFQFGLDDEAFSINAFGNGLINATWKIDDKHGNAKYILQKINSQVFKQPADIAFNIRLVDNYLKQKFPTYIFAAALDNKGGEGFVKTGGEFYKLLPFIPSSHTIDVVEKPQQAYEAAMQFGKFTKLLSGFDAQQLKLTLPGFHSLGMRYQQFEDALKNGNAVRIEQSKELIEIIQQNKNIVDEYRHCKEKFILRVTHHDTKISNVLFDDNGKGICVIDLDTVMPGFFISDVGDMMRTYLCPVSEEEKDFTKIIIRKEFYDAVANGYLSEMGAMLNEFEKQHFNFAGQFMMYMQALRFLTDHLNNDIYYGAKYQGHNFVRAGNQLTLLKRFREFTRKLSG